LQGIFHDFFISKGLEGQSILEKVFQDGDVNFLINQIADLQKKILGYHTCEVMSYKKLHVLHNEISKYVSIIQKCREYELQ
jgi:hypothetical protein